MNAIRLCLFIAVWLAVSCLVITVINVLPEEDKFIGIIGLSLWGFGILYIVYIMLRGNIFGVEDESKESQVS